MPCRHMVAMAVNGLTKKSTVLNISVMEMFRYNDCTMVIYVPALSLNMTCMACHCICWTVVLPGEYAGFFKKGFH